MLLKPELLVLMNFLRMQRELRRFTTPWLCERRDLLGGRDQVSLEMHLEAEIGRTQR